MREAGWTTSRRVLAGGAVLVAFGLAIWGALTVDDVRAVAPVVAPSPAAPIAAPAVAPEPKTRPFRIVVTSAAGGAPVAGASVRVIEARRRDERRLLEAVTGADGAAVVDPHPERSLTVIVRKLGFRVAQTSTSFTKEDLRVALEPGVPVRGRVVMADTGAPAAGVSVRPFRGAGGLWGALDAATTTGDDGRFEIAGIAANEIARIFAVKPGYCWADAIVTVKETLGDVEIVLGRGGILEGVAYDGDGVPIAGALAHVLPEGGPVPEAEWSHEETDNAIDALRGSIFPPVMTDASGRFEFRGVVLPRAGLVAGRVAAVRAADGRTARSEPVTFARDGERQRRDVRFPQNGSITVRVTSTSPLPEGIRVRVQRNGREGPDETRELGGGGGPMTFAHLRPNKYLVSVSLGDRFRGGWEQMRSVEVAEGREIAVDFAQDDTVTLAGRVEDQSGKGVAGVRVDFTGVRRGDDGGSTSNATTAADGSFSLHHLRPESGHLRVERDEFASLHSVRDSTPADPGAFEWVALDDVRPGGAPLTITLKRLGKLVGRIVPLPAPKGVIVTASSGRERGRTYFLPGEDGRFEFDAPLVGVPMRVAFAPPWTFSGDGKDIVATVLDLTPVAAGEVRDLGDVEFTTGTGIDVTLVDAKGSPLPSIQVKALERWMPLRESTTDATGKFRFDHLPKHPFVLRVGATLATPLTILVVDPSKATATFTIGDGAYVSGRVVDGAGHPVPDANVTFVPGLGLTDEEDACGWAKTDDYGEFAFRMQAGRGSVIARDSSGKRRSERIEITVSDGESRTIGLVLRGQR